MSERHDLDPAPRTVRAELGRDSLAFRAAFLALSELWGALRAHPEAAVKRQLWDRLLAEVYGQPVGDDRLFLQHTYLTAVAKVVAARVFDLTTDDPADILGGAALEARGIHGAVEADFFDWPLLDPRGLDLLRRLARQASRFRLADVREDVMKALYESLIDPEQRKDLGEYYTPDWLAARLARRAVRRPLTERVLDPACGSGTFLFHAIRRLRAAAAEAGWEPARRVAACAALVRGLDVHPVAVIIARVTWLLALGEDVRARQGRLTVPVFLGDAMQWNIETVATQREVVLEVPDEPPLRVPAGFAEDQGRLEGAVAAMRDGIARDVPAPDYRARLARQGGAAVAPRDLDAMEAAYARVLALHRAGRDGIWPFVLRNLVQPLWLARPEQRADVLLGNPPWVAYRFLSAPMQQRLRDGSMRMKLWVGGHLSTQQDLCALFTMRAAMLYLKPGGRIGFVLPYAALNRPTYAGLRAGDGRDVGLRWQVAWSFDEKVRPLFPVPACAMVGVRGPTGRLPRQVVRFAGALPRRDAGPDEARAALRGRRDAWPPVPTLLGASPYRARFKNGATVFPRRFFLVELEATGRLGANPAAPMVRGRAGGQDKAPWRTLDPPRGAVEREFLRPLILGETLAPFRLLPTALAVIPALPDGTVMDSRSADREGFSGLRDWMEKVEGLWNAHARKDAAGDAKMTLGERLDHQRTLKGQFPLAPLRVAYAKAGTLFAASVVREAAAVIDHMAYWTAARSAEEARYLVAVLNADALRLKIAAMQSKGQGGARDFDNLIWELPIPEYDARDPAHRALAALATEAEAVAAAVPLREGAHFTAHRRAIRDALAAAGISARLDAAALALLG